MTYETRYCAFVDILGFSEVIKKGEMAPEVLRTIISMVHKPPLLGLTFVFANSDLKVESISDAVCVSTAPTDIGLAHMLNSLQGLTTSLLSNGLFVRGAIVKGPLYHDDKMVFGKALIDAYDLENTVAKYPRTMLSREVAEIAKRLPTEEFNDSQDFVRQSDDGPFFLHVLSSIQSVSQQVRDPIDRPIHIRRLATMVAQIQRRFDDAVDNPRHFEKVQWFARYWNYCVVPYARGEPLEVKGPGVEYDDGGIPYP